MPYSAATNIFVRADATSDDNGGGFDYTVTTPGDSSLARQTAPVLIVDGSTYTATCTAAVVTISGAAVDTAWRGLTINLITAPGGTPGRYTISDVNTGANTLTLTQTTGMSGGACTLRVGGAIKTVGQCGASFAAGNVAWLMSVGGNLDITSTSANVAGGRVSINPSIASEPNSSVWRGCTSDRFDGGRPTIRLQTAMGSNAMLSLGNAMIRDVDIRNAGFAVLGLLSAERAIAVDARADSSHGAATAFVVAACEDCYVEQASNTFNANVMSIRLSALRSVFVQTGTAVSSVFALSSLGAASNPCHLIDCILTSGMEQVCQVYGVRPHIEGCIFNRVNLNQWIHRYGGAIVRRCVFRSRSGTVIGDAGSNSLLDQLAWWNCGTKYSTTAWASSQVGTMIDLAADPFVDAANRDFRLTTAAKAVLQQAWSLPLRGLTSQTTYRGINAVEEQISSGGGGGGGASRGFRGGIHG